jgi:hypothetical protein
MRDYVDVSWLTCAETQMRFHVYPARETVVVSLAEQYGSAMNIHLAPAELDRLSALLDEAKRALRPAALSAVA